MTAFILRWAITTIAVLAAAHLHLGISYETWGALIGASLLLGIINAFVRPTLMLLSAPFIIVTLGIFIFVINALLLMFVSKLVPGFVVNGFWSAFFGAIIISFVSWALSSFFRGSDGRIRVITHHPAVRQSPVKQANARVID